MNDAFERATIRTEMDRRRRRGERRARGTHTGFRIHATAFVGVQILLVTIWGLIYALGGDGYPWFLWPLGGWGIGLAVHYVVLRSRIRRPGGG